MKRQTAIICLTVLLLSISCGKRSESGVQNRIGSFSLRNGQIAFTYFKGNVASIYYTTNIDSVAKQLTFPQKGWDLTFSLSHDLSKILYVNYPEGNYEICNICLYDLKTKQVDTLLKGGSLITDVYISNDNSHAYFLNASDNKNYSPIASQAPQGMDIFKITISSKIVRKITNLKAYSIQALTPTFSDSIITANIYDKQGLVMISTNTGDVEQVMINSPRNPVQEYFIPIDVRSDSMIYEAPYELYKHNIKTNKSDLILRCPDGNQFGVIQPDNNWSNILFNSGDKMYFYNVPNKN